MPFTLLQVGNTLKSVNAFGGMSAALDIPSNITLATNVTPRFAKFKNRVIVVNTPSRPLQVDESGNVYPLTLVAPTAAVALTGPNAGSLSGTYLALQTYILTDNNGNVISESNYGPLMTTAVTIASKKLLATFAVSVEDAGILGLQTRLRRTATNGTEYFTWSDSGDNTATTIENDIADASLGTVAAPSLGPAPDLTLVAEWAGRVWGVDRADVDDLRYTEAGTAYAWSALNTLPIPHVGSDAAGITALISRRNALGVARRDMFVQVTGTSRTNFAPTTVNGGEQLGVISQESVVVFNDVAYFLWRDGVYKWDSNGIRSISNGKVRTWFTSDKFFNRAMYWRAFAQLDPIKLKYRLFLASVGSTRLDRWIEYDLTTDAWYGPHKTDAFDPTCAVLVHGGNQQPYYMVGSTEGYLSMEQDAKNDWGTSPIKMRAENNGHTMGEPDYDKYFGELSVMTKAQEKGTLTITPHVGELENAPAGEPFAYDLTQSRENLGRLGDGKQATLVFEHDGLNEDVEIQGYEINPVFVDGRR